MICLLKKNILIFVYLAILILFIGCTYPQSPVDLLAAKNNILTYDISALSNAYPYWNTGFGSFLVVNDTVRADLIPTTSDTIKYKAKRLEVREKELMLRKLALIRFTINTKEFETALMNGKFRSSINANGSNGTIKVGDVYNNKRIFEILRRRQYNVSIRKGIISAGAAAVGVVGQSLYVLSDTNKATSNSYWIAFPNHEDWSTGGYLQDTYMAGVVFHEMLHNTGFSHGVDSHDATYGIQGVFTSVYGKKDFQEKYAKELEQFRGFYTLSYTNSLKSPTLYSAKNLSITDREILNESDTTTTCTIFNDGTYLLE